MLKVDFQIQFLRQNHPKLSDLFFIKECEFMSTFFYLHFLNIDKINF